MYQDMKLIKIQQVNHFVTLLVVNIAHDWRSLSNQVRQYGRSDRPSLYNQGTVEYNTSSEYEVVQKKRSTSRRKIKYDAQK